MDQIESLVVRSETVRRAGLLSAKNAAAKAEQEELHQQLQNSSNRDHGKRQSVLLDYREAAKHSNRMTIELGKAQEQRRVRQVRIENCVVFSLLRSNFFSL